MTNAIEWSPRARNEFEQVLDYLLLEWDNQVVLDFLDKTEILLNNICRFPAISPFHNAQKGIRKCVITKHITLFYRQHNEMIHLLSFWDSRQNPEKLNL